MTPNGNVIGPLVVTMKCQAGTREPFADENSSSGSQQTKPSALGWRSVWSNFGFPFTSSPFEVQTPHTMNFGNNMRHLRYRWKLAWYWLLLPEWRYRMKMVLLHCWSNEQDGTALPWDSWDDHYSTQIKDLVFLMSWNQREKEKTSIKLSSPSCLELLL